ncbi:hypothetical protein P692DRAFT_201779868 [Suillus brevipes Sb2]|nr:hypothetical protein P692DRAFT_201779868 [Suillus brevipes Sb2]
MLHHPLIIIQYRRAHPPPTSPLPPLPPTSPDPVSQHLDQVPQQPMYPAPGGLSPWSAPIVYPSKPIPTPPSPPQSNIILRGPVGQPLLHAAPGSSKVRLLPTSLSLILISITATTTLTQTRRHPLRTFTRSQRSWRHRYLMQNASPFQASGSPLSQELSAKGRRSVRPHFLL